MLKLIYKTKSYKLNVVNIGYTHILAIRNLFVIQFHSDFPTVVLKANIPLLAGRIPSEWTVSLVDNPGFGETKEHITQLANISMKISSAYIYLLETENIGGQEAVKFFRKLVKKEKFSSNYI